MLMAKKLSQTPGIAAFNSLIKSRELKEASAERIDMWVLSTFSNSILIRAVLCSLFLLIQFSQVLE